MFDKWETKRLADTLISICIDCKGILRDSIKEKMIGLTEVDFNDEAYESALKPYFDEVANRMIFKTQKLLKYGDTKVMMLLPNPSQCGYNIDFDKGLRAGEVFAFCYYLLKDKVADEEYCSALSLRQGEIIKQVVLEEAKKYELDTKRKKREDIVVPEILEYCDYFFSVIVKNYLALEKKVDENAEVSSLFKKVNRKAFADAFSKLKDMLQEAYSFIDDEETKTNNNDELKSLASYAKMLYLTFSTLLECQAKVQTFLANKADGNGGTLDEYNNLCHRVSNMRRLAEKLMKILQQEYESALMKR